MNDYKIIAAKIFIASLSLITYGELSPLMKADSPTYEFIVKPMLWTPLSILLAYIVVPIILLIIDNYIAYTLLSGVSLLRVAIELEGVLPPTSLRTATIILYISAIFLSLTLAVEDLSSRIRGEILRLKWSQF